MRYYKNVFCFVVIPNIILFILAVSLNNKTIGTLWAISCIIYFICFAAQPEKVFFIKEGKIKFKP